MGLPTIEKPRILFVDDDTDELNWFGQILRQEGYDVDAYTSFEDGANCAARGEYDFVLLSQGGPDFEGHCVLERATERDRHTPVLILARCMEMRCYLEAMQLGALDYLEKPIPAAFLMRTIETHLRPHAHAAA
jgi:DNA-binding response OmpR family regulator